MKYNFIDKKKKKFGLNYLLRKLEISPNGYFNYLKNRKNAANKKRKTVLNTIKQLYHQHGGRPGYRMMKILLEGRGINLSVQTVRKYMNTQLGLKSVTRKAKYRYMKGSDAYCVFDNVLNQDFTAKAKYQRFCMDFTYLFLEDGRKRYNCTVIDLYNRAVVASVNSNKIDSNLAIAALSETLRKCPNPNGILVHSDRGSQFTSKAFVSFCEENSVVQSMSRPGYPYDNAPMERYFNTLKAELINLHSYKSEDALYDAVTRYAFGWYNNQRPHTYNKGLPPAKVA